MQRSQWEKPASFCLLGNLLLAISVQFWSLDNFQSSPVPTTLNLLHLFFFFCQRRLFCLRDSTWRPAFLISDFSFVLAFWLESRRESIHNSHNVSFTLESSLGYTLGVCELFLMFQFTGRESVFFWPQHKHLERTFPPSELHLLMYLRDRSLSFAGSLKCCLIRGLLSTKYFLKCIIDCARKEELQEWKSYIISLLMAMSK